MHGDPIDTSNVKEPNIALKAWKLVASVPLENGKDRPIHRWFGVCSENSKYNVSSVEDRRLSMVSSTIYNRKRLPNTMLDLPLPKFKIDDNYCAIPPKREFAITGLNNNVDENFLRSLCKHGNEPLEVIVYYDPRNGKHLGMASMDFDTRQKSDAFIAKYNGRTIMGSTVSCFYDPMAYKLTCVFEELTNTAAPLLKRYWGLKSSKVISAMRLLLESCYAGENSVARETINKVDPRSSPLKIDDNDQTAFLPSTNNATSLTVVANDLSVDLTLRATTSSEESDRRQNNLSARTPPDQSLPSQLHQHMFDVNVVASGTSSTFPQSASPAFSSLFLTANGYNSTYFQQQQSQNSQYDFQSQQLIQQSLRQQQSLPSSLAKCTNGLRNFSLVTTYNGHHHNSIVEKANTPLDVSSRANAPNAITNKIATTNNNGKKNAKYSWSSSSESDASDREDDVVSIGRQNRREVDYQHSSSRSHNCRSGGTVTVNGGHNGGFMPADANTRLPPPGLIEPPLLLSNVRANLAFSSSMAMMTAGESGSPPIFDPSFSPTKARNLEQRLVQIFGRASNSQSSETPSTNTPTSSTCSSSATSSMVAAAAAATAYFHQQSSSNSALPLLSSSLIGFSTASLSHLHRLSSSAARLSQHSRCRSSSSYTTTSTICEHRASSSRHFTPYVSSLSTNNFLEKRRTQTEIEAEVQARFDAEIKRERQEKILRCYDVSRKCRSTIEMDLYLTVKKDLCRHLESEAFKYLDAELEKRKKLRDSFSATQFVEQMPQIPQPISKNAEFMSLFSQFDNGIEQSNAGGIFGMPYNVRMSAMPSFKKKKPIEMKKRPLFSSLKKRLEHSETPKALKNEICAKTTEKKRKHSRIKTLSMERELTNDLSLFALGANSLSVINNNINSLAGKSKNIEANGNEGLEVSLAKLCNNNNHQQIPSLLSTSIVKEDEEVVMTSLPSQFVNDLPTLAEPIEESRELKEIPLKSVKRARLDKIQSESDVASTSLELWPKRNENSEFEILHLFEESGINEEDYIFLHKAFMNLISDMNRLMPDGRKLDWINPHIDTIRELPTKVCWEGNDLYYNDPDLAGIVPHKTGCARTEGYYKVSRQKKRIWRCFEDETSRTVISSRDETAIRHKAQAAKDERAMNRRLLTWIGDNNLIRVNQLKYRCKMIKFARSRIHGWGLYALETIMPEEMIIEYVGEKIRPTVADEREKNYEGRGMGSSYMFRIDGDAVIDATKQGNYGRFINHSCNPNCTARVVMVDGEKRIVIYSKRLIERGEEITYDYKFAREDEASKIECLCGAKTCQKYLN